MPDPDLSKRARGAWGEDVAARHYRRAGYEIVDRNWRCAIGELDIVARRGDTVVFCEVKARRHDGFGGAVAAVDHVKQRRLRRLAASWLAEHRDVPGSGGWHVRFDVVAITGVAVEVYEAAF
jgi:putative endonuclease